jgi:hypothetical protein
MASSKRALKGSDALRTLEAHSGAELKNCRQIVEEAALADINAYFRGAELGQLNPALGRSLVAAAIAGGQWGFNSLNSRLSSSSVHESDLETVANEILEIVSPHTKVLNYARFRVGAIQSYVAQCEVPSSKLQTMLISKVDLDEYTVRVYSIKKAVLSNEDSVFIWLNSVDELSDFLSNSQLENNDKQSSRSKKGTVSTKSISSYSKHWQSYASEILSLEIGFKWSGILEDSIQSRFSDLANYKARSWDQLQRDLIETKSTRRAYRAVAKKPKGSSTKMANYTTKIGNSSLKITFNLPSVDKDLITPAINLLRGQLIRNPKAPSISVNLESEGNSLIVELTNPKREILSDVEIELSAHL